LKRPVIAIAVTLVLAATATYQYVQFSAERHQADLLSSLHIVEQTLSETKSELLGYTTFTRYLDNPRKLAYCHCYL